uniref:Adenine nucleotide translocase lysine methyltransferase n=1 Tax=Sinocyclocheilus anshuiensis TaxID=1608454 RepID=A0A671MPT0_9TELE
LTDSSPVPMLREIRCTNKQALVTLLIGSAFAGVYRLWAMFCMPGLRVPFRLKVPFLPSTIEQTVNVIKLLEGRKGHLADLGSGDGRLAFAASSMGFQCTGFEINSILLACSRSKAWWRGVPHSHIHFVKQDFWKTNLSKYRNVTVFLAPAVVCSGKSCTLHTHTYTPFNIFLQLVFISSKEYIF